MNKISKEEILEQYGHVKMQLISFSRGASGCWGRLQGETGGGTIHVIIDQEHVDRGLLGLDEIPLRRVPFTAFFMDAEKDGPYLLWPKEGNDDN